MLKRGEMDSFLIELIPKEVMEKYHVLTYVVPEITKPVTTNYKVSICTNCMGYAESVKKTVKQNIEDNLKSYSNIEYVLLNYNSKDDLEEYVKNELMQYIECGILNYYHTIEPQYYSMAHSRNVTFKVAEGDIVASVDADHFTTEGFAAALNLYSNQFDTNRLAFIKGRWRNRGRVAFFRKPFIEELAGYDELIEGYGFEDKDLLFRAEKLGFKIITCRGQFCKVVEKHRRHQMSNYKSTDQNWRYTQRRNTLISILNLAMGRYKANEGLHWGKAHLVKNFKEEVDV